VYTEYINASFYGVVLPYRKHKQCSTFSYKATTNIVHRKQRGYKRKQIRDIYLIMLFLKVYKKRTLLSI
jgi:hypothetical protein